MLALSAVFMLMTFVVFVGYGLFAASRARPCDLAATGAGVDAPDFRRRVCGARRQAGAVRPLGFLRHHQLCLRHQRGELAVAAGDAGLPDRGGAAAMQRRAFGVRGVADRDAGEEIGLALDRGGDLRRAGRLATAAVPPRLSASAISAPPCSTPLRLLSCSVTTISAVTRSGDTWVIFMPMKSANGGCRSARQGPDGLSFMTLRLP